MRKPRCYLINNRDFNVTGAETYGEVVTLYDGQPHDVFSTSKHAFNIKNKLSDMESSDYLIIAGNMILVLIAFGVILKKFNYVNVLLFDVRQSTYTARVIPDHQLV